MILTLQPDASLKTSTTHCLKLTVPASWLEKKRPVQKLLDAAKKHWQLGGDALQLEREDGSRATPTAAIASLKEGETLTVVRAAPPFDPEEGESVARAAPPVAEKTDSVCEDFVTLGSGARLPLCGLGTGGVPGLLGEACVDIVAHALRSGVRLVDTASQYGNEKEVGRALRKSGVPREDVFLVTKVAPLDQGFDAAFASVIRSLERLGVDAIDLVVVRVAASLRRSASFLSELADEECKFDSLSYYQAW